VAAVFGPGTIISQSAIQLMEILLNSRSEVVKK
jgi:hypothetical protein